MSDRWTKANVIFAGMSVIFGGLGVILAAGAFFPQEVRCLFGIKSEVCASQSTGIKSDAGANYQKLQNYLASGDFQAANSETRKLMLWIARSGESLNREDIDQFFCTDLLNIDRLWLKHSNGKFGFSVQQQIWQESQRNYLVFEERVGWRVNGKWVGINKLKFDLDAPKGHLPDNFFIMKEDKNFSLESKLRSCGSQGMKNQ